MASIRVLVLFSLHIYDLLSHFLIVCVAKLLNLHIFKRAEPIGGEQKCHKVRYRGHCARVEIGEGGVVAEEDGDGD